LATHFKTIGPLKLRRTAGQVDRDCLVAFWKQVNSMEHGRLSKAVGVYVLATRKGDVLTPWYVGKSDNGFKSRLSENHHAFQLIANSQPKGSLYLFLFAKVSPKKGVLAGPPKKKFLEFGDDVKTRRKPRRSINKLEFLLIHTCLLRNPNLVNEKEKKFYAGLVVPGYLYREQDKLSDSAVSLGKMLGIT
jgi:hypothetical protein